MRRREECFRSAPRPEGRIRAAAGLLFGGRARFRPVPKACFRIRGDGLSYKVLHGTLRAIRVIEGARSEELRGGSTEPAGDWRGRGGHRLGWKETGRTEDPVDRTKEGAMRWKRHNAVVNRREFLKVAGKYTATAVGVMGMPGVVLGGNKEWFTVEPKESDAGALHYKSWAGYNSQNVKGPFEKEYGVPVTVSLFTDNPSAFNEIKGGKYKFYDLASFDMAWVPRLAENDFIEKLDLETWKPLAWDHYIPQFALGEYEYAQLNDQWQFDANGDLYGLPQRFGIVAAYANTNRVPRDVWGESFDWIWNPGTEYNIGLLDRMFWTIQLVMYWCNIDPFAPHTDADLEKVREETIKLFENAKALYSDMPMINTALLHEEVDVCFEGDNFVNGPLRQMGRTEFQTIVPKRANPNYPEYPEAPNNAGGSNWVETSMIIKNPDLHPAAYDFLRYMQEPETNYELSWPDKGSACLVPHKYAWDKWNKEQRIVLEADYMQNLMTRCRWYAGVPDLEKFNPIWEEAKMHIGKKHKEARRWKWTGAALA
jgi:spermidine/putrescine transport system substrate-binding protein